MNKSHLIPTTVTDKNGKSTTVHKKQYQPKTGKARMPAPLITAPVKKKPVKAP